MECLNCLYRKKNDEGKQSKNSICQKSSSSSLTTDLQKRERVFMLKSYQ